MTDFVFADNISTRRKYENWHCKAQVLTWFDSSSCGWMSVGSSFDYQYENAQIRLNKDRKSNSKQVALSYFNWFTQLAKLEQFSCQISFSSPDPAIHFDCAKKSRLLAAPKTGSPRFTNLLSNLTNLIGWKYRTSTLSMLKNWGRAEDSNLGAVQVDRGLCGRKWVNIYQNNEQTRLRNWKILTINLLLLITSSYKGGGGHVSHLLSQFVLKWDAGILSINYIFGDISAISKNFTPFASYQ